MTEATNSDIFALLFMLVLLLIVFFLACIITVRLIIKIINHLLTKK